MNHTQLHSTTAGKCSMSFCSIANGKHNKNTFMKNGKENKEYIISQRSLHFSLSIAISESNLVDESALRRAKYFIRLDCCPFLQFLDQKIRILYVFCSTHH